MENCGNFSVFLGKTVFLFRDPRNFPALNKFIWEQFNIRRKKKMILNFPEPHGNSIQLSRKKITLKFWKRFRKRKIQTNYLKIRRVPYAADNEEIFMDNARMWYGEGRRPKPSAVSFPSLLWLWKIFNVGECSKAGWSCRTVKLARDRWGHPGISQVWMRMLLYIQFHTGSLSLSLFLLSASSVLPQTNLSFITVNVLRPFPPENASYPPGGFNFYFVGLNCQSPV